LRPGQKPPFRPEDIILRTGDIVFIEARQAEVFYTGGLLPPGEHLLPRDIDLDVVEAVARVQGPLVSSGVTAGNISGSFLAGGLGVPPPRLLSVLRRTPEGCQMTIRVDLHQALCDPRERILVQPGDVLILQENPGDAVVRYFTQVFQLNFVFNLFQTPDATGTATLTIP
jgi:hypothetical protein